MEAEYFDKISIGQLTISSVHCNNEKDYIRIQIEDKSSSMIFLEAEIDFKSFAKCITGSACMPIKFGLRGIERVGKKHEVKSLEIVFPVELWYAQKEEQDRLITATIKPYEVDDWAGHTQDVKNHHNYIRKTENGEPIYRVSFYRWVNMENKKC